MTRYGYHASHEQFTPRELLRYATLAEKAGFESGMCSDHFAPWSVKQGQSGYAWSWLGAALQATSMSFGVVTAPVGRYNPAIIAQAAATLAEMFPGRFWIAVGSGLLANEHITGEPWPAKDARKQRLMEAALVIKRLWQGETVTHDGAFRLEKARLWTRPESPPLLIGAAISPDTAKFAGGWADGLITTLQPREKLEEVLQAFHDGGGRGKPMFLQAQISWAPDEHAARQGALDQWRPNVLPSNVLSELREPEDFDEAAQFITAEEMDGHIRISADLDQHVKWLREYAEMGFSEVLIHNVNRGQEPFIRAFGERVLPVLNQRRAA